jgi:two-component system NtrC family sensor kinase
MHARYDPVRPPAPPATILVVDDEEANVKLMRSYLKMEGFEVATARSGVDALEQVRRGVDLVLLDLRMPGMDGLEVCRRIRSDQANARLPVVFLTAEVGDIDSEVRGLAAGADEFLHKPVHRPALMARVRNLLRLANAERDRQLVEQLAQAEKLAAIGQIAAGVAHEINNPLAFILSNLSTLTTYVGDVTRVLHAYRSSREGGLAMERELDFPQTIEDIGSLIRETSEGGQRVRAIVQGLTSFSRTGEAGGEPLDLSEVALSTLLLTEREISSRATLCKELSAAPVPRAPRNKLEQVVLNLVVNALQALDGMALEDCRIRIGTGHDAAEAWLSVSDSGCGMDPAVRARLFEPFFTTKPVGEGTGMGLSFSDNVIRNLGGRIEVESELGKGSTFTVRLPRTAS